MMKELFRDGNWRLLVSSQLDPPRVGLQHRCRKDAAHDWWYFRYERCDYCCENPPDGIIGLHALYNWDR